MRRAIWRHVHEHTDSLTHTLTVTHTHTHTHNYTTNGWCPTSRPYQYKHVTYLSYLPPWPLSILSIVAYLRSISGDEAHDAARHDRGQLHCADRRYARHVVAQVPRTDPTDLHASRLLSVQRHLPRDPHLLPSSRCILRGLLRHGCVHHADVLQVRIV